MKKKLISLLSLFSILQGISAQDIPTKYYDSSWSKTDKDSAFYITKYQKTGLNFQATTYWNKSGKIYSISFSPDTTFSDQVGLYKKYYESGQINDSSFYNTEGEMIASHYYYPTGKIWVNYSYDPLTDKKITEAFDVDGNRINDFLYFREAQFKDGPDEWKFFLAKNIKTQVPIKKGARKGRYTVIVKFTIDHNGKITDVQPETSLGFGMEDELVRVIKKSPKWIPAIWLNMPANAYRRQPLTFVVSD